MNEQSPRSADPPDPHWLPDFCSLPVIVACVLVAQLVLLAVMLAPSAGVLPSPLRLLAATAFVQWLALMTAASLCKLRPWLQPQSFVGPAVIALLLVAVVVASGSALVYSIDHSFDLGLTLPVGGRLRFVAGSTGVALLVAGALFRYFYIRKSWQRQVQAQAKAQTDALTARLRPHFLFNTLNAIASLIETRPQQAVQAVENLSDLLRASLKTTDHMSTLESELDLVSRFLEIEQLRLGDRLRVRRTVDPAALPVRCPALLLQPLVENAIVHGIARIQGGGDLVLTVSVVDGMARIVITNPLPTNAPALSGHSIGQSSVRHRLAWHYGERARLSIAAADGYYEVALELPRA